MFQLFQRPTCPLLRDSSVNFIHYHIFLLSRKCPDEIDTSGVRLEEDGTQKARLWLVRANDLPEMDELLTLRFNGLYHNMIKNIAETGRG